MRKAIFIAALLASSASMGQDRTRDYINSVAGLARRQSEAYSIPASIILAQAVLESGAGTSMLARLANNHFGVKCGNWKGGFIRKKDDKPGECFRRYASVEESFEDHSRVLSKPRYASLFTIPLTDYRAWARGLQAAGYATSPTYARDLVRCIEKYGLSEYDIH